MSRRECSSALCLWCHLSGLVLFCVCLVRVGKQLSRLKALIQADMNALQDDDDSCASRDGNDVTSSNGYWSLIDLDRYDSHETYSLGQLSIGRILQKLGLRPGFDVVDISGARRADANATKQATDSPNRIMPNINWVRH